MNTKRPRGTMVDTLVNANWKDAKFTRDAEGRQREMGDLSRVSRAIGHASRYKLDEEAVAFVSHISDRMFAKPGQVTHINAPCGLCFFEFPWEDAVYGTEIRLGMLYIGQRDLVGGTAGEDDWGDDILKNLLVGGSTKKGTLLLITQTAKHDMSIVATFVDFNRAVIDFQDGTPYEVPFLTVDKNTADQYLSGVSEEEFARYLDGVSYNFAALCAVLTSPKVLSLREEDFSKLNRSRKRMGRPPKNSYKEVLLKLPKPEGSMRSSAQDQDDAPATKKIRHMVSLFTRIKLGKIEVVSPHWRGDASKGIKMPSYFAKGQK